MKEFSFYPNKLNKSVHSYVKTGISKVTLVNRAQTDFLLSSGKNFSDKCDNSNYNALLPKQTVISIYALAVNAAATKENNRVNYNFHPHTHKLNTLLSLFAKKDDSSALEPDELFQEGSLKNVLIFCCMAYEKLAEKNEKLSQHQYSSSLEKANSNCCVMM